MSPTNIDAQPSYLYPVGLKMTEKLPLSTTNEARSCLWGASSRNHAPGVHAEKSMAAEMKPCRVEFEDGSFVMVTGPRREMHRRVLDFILSEAKAVHIGGDEHVFFFDIANAAAMILGHKSYYTQLANIIISMRNIKLDYYAANSICKGGISDEGAPLMGLHVREFKAGVNDVIDGMAEQRGIKAEEIEGKFMVRISGVYIRNLASKLTLSYQPALPQIFRMGPVAAQLARTVLSHQFRNSSPLQEMLDLVGAPKGSARDRAIQKMRSGSDIDLLAELGITIREHGPRRQLVVDYRAGSTNKTLAITQNFN